MYSVPQSPKCEWNDMTKWKAHSLPFSSFHHLTLMKDTPPQRSFGPEHKVLLSLLSSSLLQSLIFYYCSFRIRFSVTRILNGIAYNKRSILFISVNSIVCYFHSVIIIANARPKNHRFPSSAFTLWLLFFFLLLLFLGWIHAYTRSHSENYVKQKGNIIKPYVYMMYKRKHKDIHCQCHLSSWSEWFSHHYHHNNIKRLFSASSFE